LPCPMIEPREVQVVENGYEFSRCITFHNKAGPLRFADFRTRLAAEPFRPDTLNPTRQVEYMRQVRHLD
ncbi:unnamed protein product, partial [marine sediment metagenome]